MNDYSIISVIIPTFKEWDRLADCLGQLRQQTLPQERLEIIVVNNDPNSLPPNNFFLSKNVKLLEQSLPGSYASRNLGVINASGEIIAFTDSDCLPAKDWIEEGVNLLNKGADLVGGKVEFFKEKDGGELAYIFEKQFSFNQKRNVESNGQSITANLFVKKSVFHEVGNFPEGLLSGGDFHWTKKASTNGFRLVYGENVVVKHPARKSIASLKSKKRRTSGGMYFKFFRDFSLVKKISYSLFLLRPPVTVFLFNEYTFYQRLKLFSLRWYLEFIGVQELFKLDFTGKQAERT
ncbi:glycosyltransferase [Algoriphagus limi]|uniref:Glycosyltransferase n=1 Tax=Algoriphagus limi TaxID=2975273 RepID=A0ABT2G125_9BACT|nr:glycosyltransferase [Algoriphagus limi]MCS5488966.1 glycosyltransferase [Algoriphagus limi]